MKITVLLGVLLVASFGLFAQDQTPAPPPPGQTLSPDQLADLVAPIALYPDPLLSQVLVASTYPLEVVQAFQWLQRNPGLTGPDLTAAAAEQNWDPSIQALVVFPDVLKRLNDDVSWTTNLGNAFLAQQQDVMDAVQRMRQQAQQAGKLTTTPQENVVSRNDGGQPYIEIEPANPEVIYVPVYDPVWIWGPPRWYPYPRWYWPPRNVILGGIGFGFGGGINVGFYFGGGWNGWGGWGWHPGWGNRTVIVNNTFIHQNNFNITHIDNAHGTSTWSHDATHRGGVPYANPALNDRFRGNVRQNVAPRSMPEPARNDGGQPGRNAGGQPPRNFGAQPPRNDGGQPPGERFGNRDIRGSAPPAQNRSVFGGMDNGRAAQTHAEHGYSSMGPARSAPARSAPAPRPAPGGGGRRK
jgi:hypothetical protein